MSRLSTLLFSALAFFAAVSAPSIGADRRPPVGRLVAGVIPGIPVEAADAPGPWVDTDAPEPAPNPSPAPVPEPDATPEYRIRTGDRLDISIPFEEGTQMTVPVRPDGRISYLFNIELPAAGKTYRELHDALEKELGRYYRVPRVTVIGNSFAGNAVFVMGPVAKPGAHEIRNDTRLLDVLSDAGVLSVLPQVNDSQSEPYEIIDLDGAYIARGETVLPVNFRRLLLERDLRQNIVLQPRDFIFIPGSDVTGLRRKVYICGSVESPRVYWFNKRATFVEAMAAAGGPVENVAYSRDCVVVRRGSKELIHLSYNEIVKGDAPDPELESGDILYVPMRPLRYGSQAAATVIQELIAPLQAVVDADNVRKDLKMKK